MSDLIVVCRRFKVLSRNFEVVCCNLEVVCRNFEVVCCKKTSVDIEKELRQKK